MSFGGYHPFPRRLGGGRPRLRVVHDSLNAARGDSLDASNSSTLAWVENMAHARAITFDGYGTNDRLACQWDPDRMTDMLSRWESILKIVRSPQATDHERRQAVRSRFRRFLSASSIHSRIVSALTEALGDFFVQIEYIDIANAVIHVPDASYPWGTVADGAPWSSTVAHVLVLMESPAGATESDFYLAAGNVALAIDGILPSWVTFDWYRAPTEYSAISVSGGPSRAGFYLDSAANLDNNVFDV